MKFALAIVVVILFSASTSGDDAMINRGNVHSDNAEKPRRIPDILYIPTPPDVVDEMLRLAHLREEDVVYDLGCGDGRIVIAAAKQYGCRAVGIDIDPLRVADARQRVRENGLEHLVRIEQGDFHDASLKEATVVTLYLSTNVNTQLIPLLNQAKPEARIVSHLFAIKSNVPHAQAKVLSREDHRTHEVFLWKTPLNAP